jgi:hypothetical protein
MIKPSIIKSTTMKQARGDMRVIKSDQIVHSSQIAPSGLKIREQRSKGKTSLILPTLIMLLSGVLSSCSNYSSAFGCRDARGLNCVPLSQVDRQIDSGEIERIGKRRKCKGSYCATTLNHSIKHKLSVS